MTWHKIISVERSFFGKYYKIKCEDGELFKRVPLRDTFGTPVVGAFVRTKANMFLGIRYEVMLNQSQKDIILSEFSKYLVILTPDEIIEMVDILKNIAKPKIKNIKILTKDDIKQTNHENIKNIFSFNRQKISAITQIANNQKHR